MPRRRPLDLLTGALLVALACAWPAPAAARTVLVESFGSVACPDCPPVRDALETLSAEMGDDVLAVEYFTQPPLQSPESAQRAAYYTDLYGILTMPAVFFDGADLYFGGGSAIDTCRAGIQTHAAIPSPITIDAAALFSESARAGSLTVEIRIGPGGVPRPDEVFLRALFVEDDVAASGAPDGRDRWNGVVRRVLDERALRVGAADQIQFERWDLPLDAGWTVTNMRAIVFLQRDSDGSVLGTTVAADLGGLQPLPLSGLDESRVNLLPCRPNPLRIGETRILFTLPDPGQAKVQVVNAGGRVVRVLTDGPRPEGVHDVRWDGRDFTGRRMATGMYVVRLETIEGVLSRKLVLLR